MARRTNSDNPTVRTFHVNAVRKGQCGICFGMATFKRQLFAKISPFKRKPNGESYTETEMKEALEDFKRRWERGPVAHPMCMAAIVDRICGFDIVTGTYRAPLTDMAQLFDITPTSDNVEVPTWTDIEVGVVDDVAA